MLKNLKSLRLGLAEVNDISAVEALSKLEIVALGGFSLKNVDSLTMLSNLKELSITSMNIEDPSGLSKIAFLEQLKFFHSTTNIDILSLKKLKYLEIFDIDERLSDEQKSDLCILEKEHGVMVDSIAFSERD